MVKRNVFIIGTGITGFGENYEISAGKLASKALTRAIESTKITKESVQSTFIGSLVSGSNSQPSIGANCLRDSQIKTPHVRIEAGNA
ncbi:MAG: hypothetical protein ACTSQA_09175, partial [Candidatus Heimdallarchaeaceae archaeon]